ncbi:hypothetical protein [Candidatus Nitrososphaera evergladensis]|uniref:hypothetical protein n=1 Tax=Candidatus Nitrososphaera evergladensis TaxID=1459637 RepID=UPI0011E5B502|nr:hypothetical protein [Candidatus Nitrososphaera evergladensis]
MTTTTQSSAAFAATQEHSTAAPDATLENGKWPQSGRVAAMLDAMSQMERARTRFLASVWHSWE